MSKKALHLPQGTHKLLKPGREEIHVPAAANKYSDPEYLNSHRLVAVEDMPEWFHKGFDGVKKLNLVQSQVYECAMLSSVGLWWECDCRRTCCCAPRRELERRTWR